VNVTDLSVMGIKNVNNMLCSYFVEHGKERNNN
jgi:hypothetical protein